MNRIAILADNRILGQQLAGWTRKFYVERGQSPLVELYEDEGQFYKALQCREPSGAIVALSGVAGLNAAEHLHALCPGCGLIWCSDLDFSLHAYRLRAEYFIISPATNADLRRGLSLWQQRCSGSEKIRHKKIQ